MLNKRLILIAAELLAVAVLRLIFVLRRDRKLPKGSKVGWIKGKKVFNPFVHETPVAQPQKETFSIAGWVPPPRRDRIQPTPDSPPDA